MNDLTLYVWENVLRDWTAGIMFALAHDANEARDLIRAKMTQTGATISDEDETELASEPIAVTDPAGFYVYGGA